ncbi:MAG: hypothetical protein WEF51_00050, partial [Chloroflexota bacterium]
MTATTTPRDDPQDRQLRRTWWFLAGSFVILGVTAAVRLAGDGARPIDVVSAGLVIVVGCAAILHRNAVQALEVGGREEAESVARILQ